MSDENNINEESQEASAAQPAVKKVVKKKVVKKTTPAEAPKKAAPKEEKPEATPAAAAAPAAGAVKTKKVAKKAAAPDKADKPVKSSKKKGGILQNKNLPYYVATVIFLILAVGLIAGYCTGTLSGFGFDTIGALCPLGAFTTMIATKTLVPRAIISIVLMAIAVWLLGRAFCAYMCPVPVINRIGHFFKSSKARKKEEADKKAQLREIAEYDIGVKTGCGHHCATCPSKQKHGKVDSRHAILAGALGTSLIFGFPVFCLVCPIGLSFATIVIFSRLFMFGDTTWSCVLIPVVLVFELVFLRKWCTRFCPISALMTFVSRFSKTTLPVIDNEKCIETTTGKPCSRCAEVCSYDINLRHPEFGERDLADCSRCRACVVECPTQAISLQIKPKQGFSAKVGNMFPNALVGAKAKAEESEA